MINKKPVITASEIGQFHYCSISWYLQKCGYKPKSESLNRGKEQHKKIGVTIDYLNNRFRKSKIIAIFGFILFCFGLLFIFIEVVL